MRAKILNYTDAIEYWPNCLYKYRSTDDPYHMRIITHKELYFASFKSFYPESTEYSLQTDYDSLTDEEIERWFYNRSILLQIPESERANWIKNRLENSPIRDAKWQEEVERNYRDDLSKRHGILSLSANPNNENLWEQFASDRSGFCIGFNSKLVKKGENELLCPIGPVNYYDSNNPPKLKALTFSDEERLQAVNQIMYSLPDILSEEEEYRLVKMNLDGSKMSEENRKHTFDSDVVDNFILGLSMTQEKREELREVIRENFLDIPIYIEKRNPKTDSISIEIFE